MNVFTVPCLSCSEMFGSLKVKPTLEEVLELGGLYCALTSREAGNAQDFMISIMISVYFDMFHYVSIICRFLFFSFLRFLSFSAAMCGTGSVVIVFEGHWVPRAWFYVTAAAAA